MTDDFSPRFPWYGGDLQTVRNYLVPPRKPLAAWSATRIELKCGDASGDRLLGALHLPGGSPRHPLVVLVHGLTGCEGSFYVIETARYLLSAGYPVFRLNLRGAGPSRATCAGHYSAASSGDLAAVIGQLAVLPPASCGVAIVGYSLGGSILLKYLAESTGAPRPVAAVAVSTPLDLAATARRMMSPRNTLYHRWLLARMKAEAQDGAAAVSPAERQAIQGARTIFEYDDSFIAPRFGFHGAEANYAGCSATGNVSAIATPTLLVHARNDPWIPSAAYKALARATPSAVTLALVDGGGHVGFHGRDRETPWHNARLRTFIEQAARGESREGSA